MFHNLWKMLRTSEGCDAFDELDANECRKMENLSDLEITNVSKEDFEYSEHDGSAESPIIQANWDTHPLLTATSGFSDTEEGRFKTGAVAEEEVTEAQTVVSEEVIYAKITWDESNNDIQQEEDTFFDTSEDKMEAIKDVIGDSANDNQNLLINLEINQPLKDSTGKPSESTLKLDAVSLIDLMGDDDLQRLKKETRLLIRNQKVRTKTINNWIGSSPASVENHNSLEQNNNMETKIQNKPHTEQFVNTSTPAVKEKEERVPTPKDISSDDDTSDYWSTSSSHMTSPPPTTAIESIVKNNQNGEDDDDSYRPMYKTYTESVVERDIRMAKEREEELRKDRLLALAIATAPADQTPAIVVNKKMNVPIEQQQDVTKIIPLVHKNTNEATPPVDLNNATASMPVINKNASISVENRKNNEPTPLVIKANTETLRLSDKNVKQLLAFIERDALETIPVVRETTEEVIPVVMRTEEVIPAVIKTEEEIPGVKKDTEVIPIVKKNAEEVIPVRKNTEDAIPVLKNDALESPSAINAASLPISQKNTQRRMASSRIQQEIEEQMKREMALRDEGVILTTSLETVDDKAAQIGEAVRAEVTGYSSIIRHIQENENATAFPFAPQPPDSPILLSPSFTSVATLSSLSPVPSPPESVTSDEVPSTPTWGSSARREAFANSINRSSFASLDNSGATNRKGIMSKFIASGGRMVLNPTIAMPRAPAPDNQSLHAEAPSLPDASSAIQGKQISSETNAPVNNVHTKVQAPRKNPPKSSAVQSRMDEEFRQMRLRESELKKCRNRASSFLVLPNANEDAIENPDMDSGPSSGKPTLLIAQWEEMIQQSSEC